MEQSGAVIFISQTAFDQMLAHVLSDRTQEMCGLLAGERRQIDRVLPVPNAVRSPIAYRMDGLEFIAAMRACDFEPLGIYHSHLAGPPTPSATDIAEANYPEAIYIIISLHRTPPSVRGFYIVRGRVQEVALAIN